MSETLQRIFDHLPEPTLEHELARIESEIERLTERKDMVLRSLGRVANVEQLSLRVG
jgi:hypothetical protein